MSTESQSLELQQPLPAGFGLGESGRYKILRILGQGSFGITYLALDTHKNAPRAIKEYFPDTLAHREAGSSEVLVLSPGRAGEFEEGLRRFQREALTLGDFSHPNIIKVHLYFPANGTAYFVMDYLEGQSLGKMVEEGGGKPLDEEVIRRDCLPVLKGLEQLHGVQFLHLDIKPDNILKTKYGEPLLIDFGGVRFSSGRGSQAHSAMVATPGFAPPEQYSLTTEQTPATDLYAFGMTLYSLMAPWVALPLSVDRQTAVFVNESPDPLPSIRQAARLSYSEFLLRVVEACTQIRQADRPRSVAQVQAMLANLDEAPTRAEVQKPLKKHKPFSKQTFRSTIGSVKFTMVYIPPGEFMMGSPDNEPGRNHDEGPRHRVRLTKGYWMGETQVTQRLWEAVMGSNPSYFNDCGSDCPVESVSWHQSQEFIRRLNGRVGWGFRLPTEAEWEYAARAGTTTPFHTGHCLDANEANYNGDYPLEGCSEGKYRGTTVKVASFAPNAWGLYDMHGNVCEWVEDGPRAYSSATVTDPTGPSQGANRVYRGGSWNRYAWNCRSAYRNSRTPDSSDCNLGLRLARTP